MKILILIILTMLGSQAFAANKWVICRYGGGESSCKAITGKADCQPKLEEKFKADKNLPGKRFKKDIDVKGNYKEYYCRETLNDDQSFKYNYYATTVFAKKNSAYDCFSVKKSGSYIGEMCIKKAQLSRSKIFIGKDKKKVYESQKKDFVILKSYNCKTKEHVGKSCSGTITEQEAKRFQKDDYQLASYNGTNGTTKDDKSHKGTCRAFDGKGYKCTISKGELREQWAKAKKKVGADNFKEGNKEYDKLKLTWDDVYFLIAGEK
jgi:hypothetical protein